MLVRNIWRMILIAAAFLSGCASVVTTVPLVNGRDGSRVFLEDGAYVLTWDDVRPDGTESNEATSKVRTDIGVDISYDVTNHVYRVIKCDNNAQFVAIACESDGCCYVSMTAQKPNLDELNLSEDERMFIVKCYINLMLKKTKDRCDVFVMSSNDLNGNPILGYNNKRLKKDVLDKKLYPFKHVAALRRRVTSENVKGFSGGVGRNEIGEKLTEL